MDRPKLAGGFIAQMGPLPRIPVRPKHEGRGLVVVMTCRLSPETAHFVDMLAQQDRDSPSGTLRRIVEHFHQQWKASVRDRAKNEEADQ